MPNYWVLPWHIFKDLDGNKLEIRVKLELQNSDILLNILQIMVDCWIFRHIVLFGHFCSKYSSISRYSNLIIEEKVHSPPNRSVTNKIKSKKHFTRTSVLAYSFGQLEDYGTFIMALVERERERERETSSEIFFWLGSQWEFRYFIFIGLWNRDYIAF